MRKRVRGTEPVSYWKSMVDVITTLMMVILLCLMFFVLNFLINRDAKEYPDSNGGRGYDYNDHDGDNDPTSTPTPTPTPVDPVVPGNETEPSNGANATADVDEVQTPAKLMKAPINLFHDIVAKSHIYLIDFQKISKIL